MLKMPVPVFDSSRNNAGVLSSRLSTDCTMVNKVTTTIVQVYNNSPSLHPMYRDFYLWFDHFFRFLMEDCTCGFRIVAIDGDRWRCPNGNKFRFQ